MSWDVMLLTVPPHIQSVSELPKDFDSQLGSARAVTARLADLLPSLDLSDPTWGILDGPSYSIEFNIGKADPVASIMLHVRGDEAVMGTIEHVCRSTGWRALDLSEGEFIGFSDDPARGFRKWAAYRDHVTSLHKTAGHDIQSNPRLNGIRVDAIITSAAPPRKWWQFWR